MRWVFPLSIALTLLGAAASPLAGSETVLDRFGNEHQRVLTLLEYEHAALDSATSFWQEGLQSTTTRVGSATCKSPRGPSFNHRSALGIEHETRNV